jgi:sugar phosphate isomerase/epimerase
MRLSVTSWSFPALALDEAWAVAQALGFGAMDVGLLHGPSLDRDAILGDPDSAAAGLRARGIHAANLYWLFGAGIADNAVSDPGAASRNRADFVRVARFARSAGIPSIFVLPGVVTPGTGRTEALRRSADSLAGLLDVATEAGVTLTVEPHVGGVLSSPAETLDLLGRVPGLRLALDYAHFVCAGFRQDEIDPLLPHAGHIHLRQARPGALQAKWGQGTIDFPALFEALRAIRYDGYVAVEYVHQDYMGTLYDDVLTETVRMRDCARAHGIG